MGMPKRWKTTFNIAAAAMLNCRKLLFWSRDICLHAILHLPPSFHTHRLKWRQDTKKVFNMTAVRHLEFAKIAILFTWPIFACDSLSPNFALIGQYGAEIQPQWFLIWRPSAILNLQNFDFLTNSRTENWNLYLLTKFYLNRITIILNSDRRSDLRRKLLISDRASLYSSVVKSRWLCYFLESRSICLKSYFLESKSSFKIF